MPAILTLHKITIPAAGTAPAKKYFFLGNPRTYNGLSAETGVEEASDKERGEPAHSVAELLGTGQIVRASIYYKVGAKRRSARIITTPDKLVAFRASKIGNEYKSGKITGIRTPRRAYESY